MDLRKHQGQKWSSVPYEPCLVRDIVPVVAMWGPYSFKGTKSRFRDCSLEKVANLSWDGEKG